MHPKEQWVKANAGGLFRDQPFMVNLLIEDDHRATK
jgi:hypothetical protein